MPTDWMLTVGCHSYFTFSRPQRLKCIFNIRERDRLKCEEAAQRWKLCVWTGCSPASCLGPLPPTEPHRCHALHTQLMSCSVNISQPQCNVRSNSHFYTGCGNKRLWSEVKATVNVQENQLQAHLSLKQCDHLVRLPTRKLFYQFVTYTARGGKRACRLLFLFHSCWWNLCATCNLTYRLGRIQQSMSTTYRLCL